MKKVSLLVFCLFLMLQLAAQKPYYKKTAYFIGYEKNGYENSYEKYSKRIREKYCCGYEIYDASNHLLEEGVYGRRFCRTFTTKDGNGAVSIFTGCGRDNSKLDIKIIYEYNSAGKRASEKQYRYYSDDEYTIAKISYIYDQKDRLIEIKTIEQDTDYLERYSYNDKDRILNITDKTGKSIIDDTVTKSTYDNKGRLEVTTLFRKDKILSFSKFDTAGRIIGHIFYFDGKQDHRKEYLYDGPRKTILEFDNNDILTTVHETLGYGDKIDREFEKNINYSGGYIDLNDYRYSAKQKNFYELKSTRHFDLNNQLIYKTIFKYKYY